MLNNLCSAEVLEKFIHAVEINTRDALISVSSASVSGSILSYIHFVINWYSLFSIKQVRITASWALANICDAICHSDRIPPFGQQMGEFDLMSMIEWSTFWCQDKISMFSL